MSALTDRATPERRVMTLFFVIDTSTSMKGDKLGAVNEAIEELKPDLQHIADNNPDAEIKVSALQFSSGCEWVYPPTTLDNFVWNRLTAGGLTDLGEACRELDRKLTRTEGGYMKETVGSMKPVILLMSDGEPTDNWESGLQKLKQNKWFKASIKLAIAIGNEANKDVLAKFTGNEEAVLEVSSKHFLKNMIKILSVRSSEIGAQSSRIGQTEDGATQTTEDEDEVAARAIAAEVAATASANAGYRS